MTIDTPKSKRLSRMCRSMSSFERELEKSAQATRSTFDFHPSCLCPDCLDVCQNNTPFPPANNENEEQTSYSDDLGITSCKPQDSEREKKSVENAEVFPPMNETNTDEPDKITLYSKLLILSLCDDENDEDEYEFYPKSNELFPSAFTDVNESLKPIQDLKEAINPSVSLLLSKSFDVKRQV